MKKETYASVMDWYKAHRRTALLIIWGNRLITGLIYCLYPLLLVWLFLYRQQYLAKAVLVPGISFVLLSLFRKGVNRKRPYEFFGTPSLIPKKTQGKSFPSRHVFSIFVIAMSWLYLFPWEPAGVILLAAGLLLASLRVLAGVHYLSDVVAGALIGILAAAIGYQIL